jgi:predicted RecB family nuclease
MPVKLRKAAAPGENTIGYVLVSEIRKIDDLGAEKKTEWSVQTIYTIIDERYSKRRATLITTNLSLEELEQKVGPRTMDRLVGSCRFVEKCAPSYRQEQALTLTFSPMLTIGTQRC